MQLEPTAYTRAKIPVLFQYLSNACLFWSRYKLVHGTRVILAVGHYWSFVMCAAIWVVDKYRIVLNSWYSAIIKLR